MSSHSSPCSPDCPSVTGKPNGSVRYCPMESPEALARHRNTPPGGDAATIRRVSGNWSVLDWRDGQWKPVTTEPRKGGGFGFVHDVPVHPDATDCCADFRCCEGKWEAAGLGRTRDQLVEAAGAPASGDAS